MKRINRWLVIAAAAVFLAGCGESGDYSHYVTLGDYRNLSAELVVEKVTDEALEAYEREQLDTFASYENADGPVKEGQLVQVSLLAENGDEIVYDFSDEDGYEMTIGKQEFGAEVDEALIGAQIGDVLDFSVSYEDDFEDAMLCGNEISYRIEIRGISNVNYPQLTDAFVQENFGEQTVEAWRDTLRGQLYSDRQAEAAEDMRSNLVQQVVKDAQITGYPKDLYQQKRDEITSNYQSYADMFGCTLDEVYEMFAIDEKALKEEYLDATYQTMVLTLIREQESITLSDEEEREKLEEYAQENEYDSVEELLTDYDEEGLRQYFLDEMTIDFLEEHAQITTVE